MAELLLELYSEEIPPNLQVSARNQLRFYIENILKEKNIKYVDIKVYSSPTRITLFIQGLPEKIKIAAQEIKGPKVGSSDSILEGFANAKNVSKKDLLQKKTDKGEFYFIKKISKELLVQEILKNILPKSLETLNWKKSMKWSDYNLMWGRPLRSILALFNGKNLFFEFNHLVSTDIAIIEQDLVFKSKKIKNFKEYSTFLKDNKIILDHKEREDIILNKIKSISKSKDFKENINLQLLEEVVNIVENPNILLVSFNKEYLKIPKEIIISTLEKHQRYFPIFDSRDRLTNYFFVVANKKDEKKLIIEGNKRVVDARLSDANFFWDKEFEFGSAINKNSSLDTIAKFSDSSEIFISNSSKAILWPSIFANLDSLPVIVMQLSLSRNPISPVLRTPLNLSTGFMISS